MRQKRIFCSNLVEVIYLLKRFSNNLTIAKMDTAIVRYTQPANLAPMQYVDDLYAKWCKVAKVIDKATLNDIFIERVCVLLNVP